MAWLGNFFSGGGGTVGGSEFVGQYVDIGQQKLRIKKVIAEGETSFDNIIYNCYLNTIKCS